MMQNHDIERHLSQAIADTTPDVLDAVLLRINDRSQDKDETSVLEFPIPSRRRSHILSWMGAVAAVLVFAFGGFFGYSHFAVDSIVGLDVNPSIQLRVNRYDQVRSAQHLNGEGEQVLDDMNLKNVDLDVAVNAIIGSMLRQGYLSQSDNALLITVENSNAQKGVQLQERLLAKVNGLLRDNAVDGAVIGQSLPEDRRLQQLATEHGISFGKAALIDLLVDRDPSLSFEELAGLSIGDIHLLIDSRGSELEGITFTGSATTAYLTEEEIIATALDFAGVDESQLIALFIRLNYQESRMVYQLSFSADAEYFFLLDASTGSLIQYEKQLYDTPQEPLDESEAAAIALDHAGVTQEELSSFSLTLDREENVYRLEFSDGTLSCRYEIDAATGRILSYDRQSADTPNRVEAGGSGTQTIIPSQPELSNGLIGEAEAKRIALEHAGYSESSVTFVKSVQYTKNGVRLYDLTFTTASSRYVYEIDAYTGDVLTSYNYTTSGHGHSGGMGNQWGRTDGHGSTSTSTAITETQARAIALDHAGVLESQVTRLESKIKTKSGRQVYELEFRVGNSNYEYIIDASSGDVMEWDSKH